MENQENKGKTPEQEEKNAPDYADLRKTVESAEQKGLSYLFLAANTDELIFSSDAKRSEITYGLIELMNEKPWVKELFSRALIISSIMNKQNN